MLATFCKRGKRKQANERVRLSKPGSAKLAHLDGENRLENNVETSGRADVSDLQPPTRLLYSSQRSGTGRGCERAMRHTSPETKRHYQLGMADQVRNAVDKAKQTTVRKASAVTFS